MAYNEKLTNRVRTFFSDMEHVQEKKMFGGIAFMLLDKMCVTVGENRIMCRIDPALHADAVQRQGCETMIMKGREYIGYVRVTEDVLNTKKELEYWLRMALAFNPKASSSKKK